MLIPTNRTLHISLLLTSCSFSPKSNGFGRGLYLASKDNASPNRSSHHLIPDLDLWLNCNKQLEGSLIYLQFTLLMVKTDNS